MSKRFAGLLIVLCSMCLPGVVNAVFIQDIYVGGTKQGFIDFPTLVNTVGLDCTAGECTDFSFEFTAPGSAPAIVFTQANVYDVTWEIDSFGQLVDLLLFADDFAVPNATCTDCSLDLDLSVELGLSSWLVLSENPVYEEGGRVSIVPEGSEPVPAPASYWLLAAGLLALYAIQRRRSTGRLVEIKTR